MREQLKTMVSVIATGVVLGFSLVAYAYANFPTKDMIQLLREDIKELRTEMNELRSIIYEKKR